MTMIKIKKNYIKMSKNEILLDNWLIEAFLNIKIRDILWTRKYL